MGRIDSMLCNLIALTKMSKINHKHSAVIFKNKKRAFYGGINKHMGYSFCLHAEIDSIYKARKRKKYSFKNMNLMVIRHTIHGLMLSKPCVFCESILKRFNFKHIYYSDTNGNIVKTKWEVKTHYKVHK